MKAPVPLHPRQSAARALGLILLGQLQIIEDNLDGILDDGDTEYLHDFRIACRRSRSLLTQVREAFPAGTSAGFREVFAWLSRTTSPQRDLDVFLADLPGLADHLGRRHARALAPLQELLIERRRAEHERLVAALEGPRLREFLPQWRAYLEGFAARRAPAAPPVREAADRALQRLFRRVLRDGARCGAGSYSPMLHELRKDGKKLRYLLEAFRGLYDSSAVDVVVRRLRKLQGVLGDIVDCHVQREWLLTWEQDLAIRDTGGVKLPEAMNALGTHLDGLEIAAQQDFVRRFGRFAAPEVRAAMTQLKGKRR